MTTTKLSKKGFSLLTFSLFLSPLAAADQSEWRHAPTLHTQNFSVQVDYQIHHERGNDPWGASDPQGPTSYNQTLTPIWANLYMNGLNRNDEVKVMLISYMTSWSRGQYTGKVQDVAQAELEFIENGYFSGELPELLTNKQVNDGNTLYQQRAIHQEIVIWVNGTIYKDPQTQMNYRIDLL